MCLRFRGWSLGFFFGWLVGYFHLVFVKTDGLLLVWEGRGKGKGEKGERRGWEE